MFKVGDVVEYEIQPDSGHLPRWDFSADDSGSGRFVEAVVVKVVAYTMTTETKDGTTWDWPLISDEETQKRPGWVRLKSPPQEESPIPPMGIKTCRAQLEEAAEEEPMDQIAVDYLARIRDTRTNANIIVGLGFEETEGMVTVSVEIDGASEAVDIPLAMVPAVIEALQKLVKE